MGLSLEQQFIALRDAGRIDAAWCIAHAIVTLGRAKGDVIAFEAAYAGRPFARASQPLSWGDVAHPADHAALAAGGGHPVERTAAGAGIRRKDRRPWPFEGPLIISKLIGYVASILDVRADGLYLLEGRGTSFEVFTIRDGKQREVAVVCRPDTLTGHDQPHIVFLATVALAGLRAQTIEATARRAGLLLCGSLRTALGLTPAASAHDDLVAYWTSEAHFAARQSLQLALAPEPARAAQRAPAPSTTSGSLLDQFHAHKAAKRFDEAWCLAHALVATAQATPDIIDYESVFGHHRRARPVGPLVWRDIQHADEDLALSLQLAKSWADRARPHARALSTLGLTAKHRVIADDTTCERISAVGMCRRLAVQLDMKLPALFYVATQGRPFVELVERATIIDGSEPVPALIFRDGHRDRTRAHDRDARHEPHAGLVATADHPAARERDRDRDHELDRESERVRELEREHKLERDLEHELVEALTLTRLPYRLRHVVPELPARWCAAVDATARRAAMIITGSLRLALAKSPKPAHADLVAFWTSDVYFQIRKDLGLTVYA